MDERRPPGVEESYEHEMRLIGPDGGDGLRAYLGRHREHAHASACSTGGWRNSNRTARLWRDSPQYWADLDHFRARMFAFLQDYDAILSPVCAHAALPHGSSIDERHFPGIQLYDDPQPHRLAGRRGSLRTDRVGIADWCTDRHAPLARRCGVTNRRSPGRTIWRVAAQPPYNRCERSPQLDPGTWTNSRVTESPARRHSGCTCRRPPRSFREGQH